MPTGGKRGGNHGPSIKNPATYEALKRCGMSKSAAARLSNGVLKKGYRRGVHRSGGKCR
jgi:hypothetical protein